MLIQALVARSAPERICTPSGSGYQLLLEELRIVSFDSLTSVPTGRSR